MAQARLTSRFWVDAYLRRLALAAIPAYVTARGDGDAGAVYVKLARLDGRAALYHRAFDLETGGRLWDILSDGDEGTIDALIARARARDPDLWVIEIEDRAGRHLLDEAGLD